jgi:predicted amidohydrolase
METKIKMKIASIQMSVIEGDKAATIEKALERIHNVKDADLVILPELWNIGFMSFDRYLPEAEDKNGPTLSAMRDVAAELKIYLHMGSFVEKDGDQYFNSSYLISPSGNILGNYRKIHLFGFNSRESEILSRGDNVVVIHTPLGNMGLCTCYDMRFPELFRRMIEKGAEMFLICSAWPYPRLEHWIMLNRVRAFENQSFLASSNTVGMNAGVQLLGHSMIVDPWGIVLSSGGDEEIAVRAEVDLNDVKKARERFPSLADRQAWLNN